MKIPAFSRKLIYMRGGFSISSFAGGYESYLLCSTAPVKRQRVSKSHLRCFTKSPVRLVLTYDYHLHAQVLEALMKKDQRGALSPFDGCETWENQRIFNS